MLFKLAPCALTVYLLYNCILVIKIADSIIFPVIKITGNNYSMLQMMPMAKTILLQQAIHEEELNCIDGNSRLVPHKKLYNLGMTYSGFQPPAPGNKQKAGFGLGRAK